MRNTIEMIFRCDECGTERQYGIALNLNDVPDNRTPLIRCANQNKYITPHTFVGNKVRGDEREEQMMREMITVDSLRSTIKQ